ncbi:MAG: M3 family metallopeptidase [Rikenellaceae bacterium]|nr:M3 family metallopeptidase [Rikenellaceae bacterium]
MTAFALAGCCDRNPLLEPAATPFDTPEFTKIELKHYKPAFEAAIAEARADLETLINNPEEPTFENTIVALERGSASLDRIGSIFFNVNMTDTSDEMQALAQEIQPLLVAFSNDVMLNPTLFERVQTVWNNREELSLDTEDSMLLAKTYKGFVRSGAGLNDEQKQTYREISAELSELTLKFGQNVLAATNAFSINIPAEDSAKVAELPSYVRDAMAAEAKAKGQTGWTVNLQYASMSPFMTYSTDRALKEQLYRAYNGRCVGGDADNTANVKRIAELRLQMANLLGYPTYADYVLEERMAENVAGVNGLLNELLTATKSYADAEVKAIEEYARKSGLYGADFELMPWDWAYFSEKYKNEFYNVSEEQTKPYFELEHVKQSIFQLAERLYGIRFVERKDIEPYNPEVSVYEVTEADGETIGVLYMDFFPRESKRGGAWMTSFREHATAADGSEIVPLISMNGNFTKPTENAPSLLTFDEFETFLHEFGHCLHGLLAEGKYASLAGTSVYRDFVELPSQIMENWATEPEFLDIAAVHYQTGEKMPAELVNNIIAAKNYLAAYANVRQLSFGISDMAFHSITEPITEDVETFERKATAPTQVLPAIKGALSSPSFTHIFSGGYAAGYYSYKWAEVLEADAFALFQQKGIFNREVAQSFRDNVLSQGGHEHPMKLYIRFRGHKPEVSALIERMDLKK